LAAQTAQSKSARTLHTTDAAGPADGEAGEDARKSRS